ncbi:MAG: ABC transporter ATP-binding protein [Caldilineaceae bacterium SB0662_bin_9]|uniref:ABC transporter ATP-binding protein n=1 Tax=Caldilineaceae bacterium SB0662_bin_9 TaxID=2605258 RepID=A0A6B1DQZ0_9CHLR|nr:ABC transporter ATP-binding protein [Caldilineaceae bacterium]MXZ42232.1 ABC transporter ATP-binding protein [Caldilineaceae bacterium SB0666_bin_21]MYD89215.1 ABC transporter ATP-binding protein [Caldilineaceae bacterium SB0662_bin_9]
MLTLKDIHVSYGQAPVLHGVSLEVPEGHIVTLLGANGAGKSTTIHAVAGLLPIQAGSIVFEGREIAGLSTEAIVRLGICTTPEGRQLFGEMTVLENLRLGAYTQGEGKGFDEQLERVFTYFPALSERLELPSYLLSGGEQQMLAIGRALMARPRLLLMDEPSLGLAPLLAQEMFAGIMSLSKAEGISVLLAEQAADLAVEVSGYGYVLEVGKVVLGDTARNLLDNEEVRSAYLGH